MSDAKYKSASRKKLITNTVVYIVLAVLAVIWVFPISWVVFTSFRAEKGSYVSAFLPQSYTIDNYNRLEEALQTESGSVHLSTQEFVDAKKMKMGSSIFPAFTLRIIQNEPITFRGWR